MCCPSPVHTVPVVAFLFKPVQGRTMIGGVHPGDFLERVSPQSVCGLLCRLGLRVVFYLLAVWALLAIA